MIEWTVLNECSRGLSEHSRLSFVSSWVQHSRRVGCLHLITYTWDTGTMKPFKHMTMVTFIMHSCRMGICVCDVRQVGNDNTWKELHQISRHSFIVSSFPLLQWSITRAKWLMIENKINFKRISSSRIMLTRFLNSFCMFLWCIFHQNSFKTLSFLLFFFHKEYLTSQENYTASQTAHTRSHTCTHAHWTASSDASGAGARHKDTPAFLIDFLVYPERRTLAFVHISANDMIVILRQNTSFCRCGAAMLHTW